MNSMSLTQVSDECTSLVYIQASERSAAALRAVAARIRRNVRQSDTLLLFERVCAVVLPGTPLEGAQAVARRLSMLLTDVECQLQVLYGLSALTIVKRLQAEQTTCVQAEESLSVPGESAAHGAEGASSMPYLAFLSAYPPRRLLHMLPFEMARRYQCVPIGIERDMLTLGTCRRLDDGVITQIQEMTRRRLFQVRCEASMIDDILGYWQRMHITQLI